MENVRSKTDIRITILMAKRVFIEKKCHNIKEYTTRSTEKIYPSVDLAVALQDSEIWTMNEYKCHEAFEM